MQPGQIIAGRYEVQRRLGRGGMGEVFLALDHRLQTEVALKQVPLEDALDPLIRQSLVSEARIMAKLSHSRIVRLFDLADTEDGMFLVLEFVAGPSLDLVLAAEPRRTPEETLHLLDQIGEGLTLAHQRGVIHRDLKPSNLLASLEGDDQRRFRRDGNWPNDLRRMQFKVADFGLAKVVEHLTQAHRSSRIVGTPVYMAPEQFRGEQPSAETDIYALGLIAYQCLAGRLPLGDANPAYFHVFVTPPPIDGIPPAMQSAIQRALSKERTARFASVAEFLRAMRTAPAPPPPPPPPPRRRWASYVASGIAAAAAIAILALGMYGLARRAYRAVLAPAAPAAQAEPAALPELPPTSPRNPPPRVDDLPPVIESARLLPDNPYPPAIRRPRLEARTRVPSAYLVTGFAAQGHLYLGSDGVLFALQEGRPIWGFSMPTNHLRSGLAPDGRVWAWSGNDQLFVFNAAGQGGELTAAARQKLNLVELPPTPFRGISDPPEARCLPSRAGNEPELAGPGDAWTVKLDQDCQAGPWRGPGDLVIAQTRSQMLYAISRSGKIQWTYRAPCELKGLVLSNGSLAGTCDEGRKFFLIENGELRVTRAYEHGLSLQAALQDGVFYAVESTAIYNRRFLKAFDRAGQEQWTWPLMGFVFPKVVRPDGKVYLMASMGVDPEFQLLGEAEK